MAWIDVVPLSEWDGELAALAPSIMDPASRRIDNIMSIHGLNPRSLAAHNSVYTSAMSGTQSLRKVDRELIAFVVSSINECHY